MWHVRRRKVCAAYAREHLYAGHTRQEISFHDIFICAVCAYLVYKYFNHFYVCGHLCSAAIGILVTVQLMSLLSCVS